MTGREARAMVCALMSQLALFGNGDVPRIACSSPERIMLEDGA